MSCEIQRRDPQVAGGDAFTAITSRAAGAVRLTDASFGTKLSPEPFLRTLVIVEGSNGTPELREGRRLLIQAAQGRRVEGVKPTRPAWGESWHVAKTSVGNLERHAGQVLRSDAEPQPPGADDPWASALCVPTHNSAETGRRVAL